MGHIYSILGSSSFKNKSDIICLDGDGSALMHMGTLASIGFYKNFKHILLNNYTHEFVMDKTN